MSATVQLKELLQLSSFGLMGAASGALPPPPPTQPPPMGVLNDLNTNTTPHMAIAAANTCPTAMATVCRHSLPNNCTIKVDTTSTHCLFDVLALKVAIEGHESTNSDFTKIERLVDFNWDLNANSNWIAVSNRKPFIAYVISRFSKPNPNRQSTGSSDSQSPGNQMIRIMNYETRGRCLAKGVFHRPIADLSFAVNSISSHSLDVTKLAVADKGGNVYIYSLKEENGDIHAHQILEIVNDGAVHDLVRLSWCPYIPSDDDDLEVEGDAGLTLALSCDTRLELFSIDVLQTLYKESVVIEVSKLKASNTGYQLIEKAHERPIVSLSIAQEVTAVCTAGLDDKIRFYSVSLNQNPIQTKVFLKEWDLCNEYQYYERDDHMNAFFFLDDFDYLLSQTDPIFWGYGVIGTQSGHIAIINLKDWRSKQTLRLLREEPTDISLEFTYRMDLTAHYVLAIRGHDAFLLHIHFPHDKEEAYNDCEPINNNYTFGNDFPYVSKVSRFQIYSSPLRSFVVKKSIDDKLLIFWITGQSLELCCIDLSSITAEETYDRNDKLADNISQTISLNNKQLNDTTVDDLMTGNNPIINGFNGFDISMANTIDMNTLEKSQAVQLPHTVASLPIVDSALNLLPKPPTPQYKPSISFPQHLPRPESPASKEIQQIFNPNMPPMSSTNALKTLLCLGTNTQPNHEMALTTTTSSHAESFGPIFPSKLPNFLNDIVKEEHMNQLKTDVFKQMQDSESRIIQVIERLDHKMSAKMVANSEQLMNNSKVQTNKIESDIREMKKELKNACKVRNEEFNKIVEKLVNKVMHEMNVIVQKGFQELMDHVNKEMKLVTKEFDKNVQSMQTKISQTLDQKAAQFQSLAAAAAPISATPLTPGTPANSQQQPINYYQMPNMRRTPQPMVNQTPHSVPTTPLPYSTPKSNYQTPTEAQGATPGGDQSWLQTEQQNALKQKQQTQNEIWRSVGAGQYEEAFTKALNLRDPELVVKICEIFKENPSQLITRIKSDQLVLISLLQQIIYNKTNTYSEDTFWKTGFIEQIITNLELENPFVVKILPALAPKLIQMLDVVSKSANGPIGEKAKILSFTFKNLRL